MPARNHALQAQARNESPYHYCYEPGCNTRTRKAYCPAHEKNNHVRRNRAADDRRKTQDPIWRLYNCSAWKRFREVFMAFNPLCQRIVEDGRTQCRYPATVLHHILSPRVRPDLMYRFDNVRGVCSMHHDPTIEGEDPKHLTHLSDFYIATREPNLHF